MLTYADAPTTTSLPILLFFLIFKAYNKRYTKNNARVMVFTVFCERRYLFRDINGKVQGTWRMNMRICTPPLALLSSRFLNKQIFVIFKLRCRLFIITHNARLRSVHKVSNVVYILPSSRFIRYHKQRQDVFLGAKMAAASLHHVAAELG
jgi:hypothetical protein